MKNNTNFPSPGVYFFLKYKAGIPHSISNEQHSPNFRYFQQLMHVREEERQGRWWIHFERRYLQDIWTIDELQKDRKHSFRTDDQISQDNEDDSTDVQAEISNSITRRALKGSLCPIYSIYSRCFPLAFSALCPSSF